MKKMFFGLVLATALFAGTAFAESNLGKLLEDAMAIRTTGTVAEVSAKFYTAIEAAPRSEQKSAIYSIFSAYLQDHREWNKFIDLQKQILQQGDSADQVSSYYNLMLGYLELNQMENARSASVSFQACPANAYLREYTRNMKKASPTSIFARIDDLLATTPVAPSSTETTVSLSMEQSTPLPPVVSFMVLDQPLEQPVSQPEKTEPKAVPEKSNANRLEVQLGGWNSGITGKLESNRTYIDLGSDVSLKRENSPYLSVQYALTHRDRIKIGYMGFSYSGNLTRNVVFDKRTFNPGASLDLKTNFYDIEGFRQMSRGPKTTWGILYGAKINDSTLEIVQHIPGFRRVGNGDSQFWYPYLGVNFTTQLGSHVGFDASIKGFSWSGGDRVSTHDVELKLRFGRDYRKNPSGSEFCGFLGYRDFRLNGALDDKAADIHFSGPIFGLEWRF